MEILSVSDSVLVKDYINGNERALATLINRHQQTIFGFILSKVKDSVLAEDIFQETFIKVINSLKRKSYNEEGKFLPWVIRIAHNLIMDYFRQNKRMNKFDTTEDFDIFDFISDDSLNAENSLVKEQIFSDIKRLVEELPKDQKEVLVMRIYKDMSFKEIAETTDVSINTALGRMRYAILNLKKMIKKHQIILEN
ncbi:MAG: sigma-70 family RNA polymerase sigma factor [Flavobacteriaceae bacterium]|nr:sigma-70 family RNA polymerase sigma factor [Flavobacteriaceae bacterium]